jgi:hypothetical protein
LRGHGITIVAQGGEWQKEGHSYTEYAEGGAQGSPRVF